MNELAIGRRKDAAIFRQQGTVKAEKKAAARHEVIEENMR